jgi:GNAT superfamily N-acetyltransferase
MLEVVTATMDDIDALMPLVAGYRTFYGQKNDAFSERAFIVHRIRTGSSHILIARGGGEALGFAQLFPFFSTVRLGPALILEDLFVEADARKRGVATALLDAALTHAHSINARVMFLETAVDNERAQRVYERNGWTREAQFYKYNAPL